MFGSIRDSYRDDGEQSLLPKDRFCNLTVFVRMHLPIETPWGLLRTHPRWPRSEICRTRSHAIYISRGPYPTALLPYTDAMDVKHKEDNGSVEPKKQPMFKAHSLKVGNRVTNAADLTLRETMFPLFLVTILYFLWGFAYGLLDTLNKHFQVTLGITRTRSSGLQAAYFGAYLPATLGYANWVLRKYGYRATFILGLILYGIGGMSPTCAVTVNCSSKLYPSILHVAIWSA